MTTRHRPAAGGLIHLADEQRTPPDSTTTPTAGRSASVPGGALAFDTLNIIHDALWAWNLETNEVYYSPAWKLMLGYREDELAGTIDTWSTLCHPDDRESTLKKVNDYLEGRADRFDAEFRMRHADGSWRHIRSRALLVRAPDGQPARPRRLIGTHIDLTAHAEAERRMARSVSLLRATLESTTDGILAVDTQGNIATYNTRFHELWRIPAEVMATGSDRQALAYVLDQLTAPDTFVAKVEELYDRPGDESFDVLHFKDGRVFERYSRPQRVGDEIVGRVWSFRDVSEREQVQRALADEVRRRQTLFDDSRDGIVVIDLEGRVIDANRRYAEMLGYSVAELTQLHIWDFDDQFSPDELRRDLSLLPQDGLHRRSRNRRRDGSTFEVEISTSALTWDNEPLVLSIIRDITESVRAERDREQLRGQLLQSQKMEAVGQLTGGIAHEFNNMLGVILGYASLAGEIADSRGDRSLVDYLGSIRKAAENARDLTAKLLAFSRHHPDTRSQAHDPAALVEGALRLLRPTLPASLRIATSLPQGLPPIDVDVVEFQQVAANLLLNASHATGQVGRVEISLLEHAGGTACAGCGLPFSGRFVGLQVADDGDGMAPDVVAHIFEPFFTTKDVGKGTGLGLSVVHGIVHTAGGHILVDSRPGGGTRFTVLMPVSELAPARETEPPSSQPPPVSGMRIIMVVDDQAEVAELLGEMLANLGHRSRIFLDADKALAAFRAAPEAFDAVISDQTMPSLSGRDLLLAMRQVRPELPVVIWTGYSDSLGEATAEALGFSAFMRKPITLDDLAAMLRRIF
jgi:PAS domain S-box-containing protein